MKASEFRIGNLLHDREDTLCRVEELSKEKVYAPAIVGGRTALPNKPIPLTEEWLLKFGLEWDGAHYRSKSFIDEKGESRKFTMHKSSRDGFWFTMGGAIVYVEFVHTLQNAFALTREELTIKEK